MLTKKDLAAIQTMFKTQKTEITEIIKFNTNELTTIMQKSTDDLIELINTGIHLQEKHNNKIDCLVDNHEYRISTLEKKTFTAN